MKNGWGFFIGITIGLICAVEGGKSQAQSLPKSMREYIDCDIKKHKWEINVNAPQLLRLSTATHPYPYLIKLNTNRSRTDLSSAWRFALSPGLGNGKLHPRVDLAQNQKYLVTNYTITPAFVVGREWGKVYGRTVLYGGVDLAGKLSFSKATAHGAESPWEDGIYGENVIKFYRNMVWLGAFQGIKIYLNHRFSFSLENHIQFRYGADGVHTWFEKNSIARHYLIWKEVEPLRCYFLGFSYNL